MSHPFLNVCCPSLLMVQLSQGLSPDICCSILRFPVLFPKVVNWWSEERESGGGRNEAQATGLIPSNWVEIPIPFTEVKLRPAFAPKGSDSEFFMVLVMTKKAYSFNNRNEESTALFV